MLLTLKEDTMKSTQLILVAITALSINLTAVGGFAAPPNKSGNTISAAQGLCGVSAVAHMKTSINSCRSLMVGGEGRIRTYGPSHLGSSLGRIRKTLRDRSIKPLSHLSSVI